MSPHPIWCPANVQAGPLACMDETQAHPWLVLSAPGMDSGSSPLKILLAVPPPPLQSSKSCLLHSTCLDMSSRTQGTCSHVVNARVTETVLPFFYLKMQQQNLKNQQTKAVCFIGLCGWAFHFPPIFISCLQVSPFEIDVSWKNLCITFNVQSISCHVRPLIWFSTASVPALWPR